MSENSSTYVLALYDISGIQNYIFASSRLKENVGASLIVGQVLLELPKVIHDVFQNRSGRVLTDWEEASAFQIRTEADVQAEIIYNGGGSAIVAYRELSFCNEVTIALAKRVLEVSYSLTLAAACIETEFVNYVCDRTKLGEKLEQAKARMSRQHPLGGLPITEQEGIGGLPVTHRLLGENLSSVQYLKRSAGEQDNNEQEIIHQKQSGEGQNSRVKDQFLKNNPFPDGFSYAVEMDDLISSENEDGYVAVVHIDGNNMGKQLQEILNRCADYEDSVKTIRTLSKTISTKYREIFTMLALETHRQLTEEDSDSFQLKTRNRLKIIPIRPLIIDGDDITFICNARLGVPLAAAFLRCLEGIHDPNFGLSLSACAGVALVHGHFPFNLAYEIAESCCKNSKKKRKEAGTSGYLDFHLVRGSYLQDMEQLRINIYGESDGEHLTGYKLLNRPYRVSEAVDLSDSGSFDHFHQLICSLSELDQQTNKKLPRSRLKKLYETYLLEPKDVENLLQEYSSRGYELDAFSFDALELMDLYEPRAFSSASDSRMKGDKA
ncbi:MAG: hypothetical protein K6T85_15890 [Gorillibacterium sp.]|nr:hypothetical protein [Gorillibacterium sp.]